MFIYHIISCPHLHSDHYFFIRVFFLVLFLHRLFLTSHFCYWSACKTIRFKYCAFLGLVWFLVGINRLSLDHSSLVQDIYLFMHNLHLYPSFSSYQVTVDMSVFFLCIELFLFVLSFLELYLHFNNLVPFSYFQCTYLDHLLKNVKWAMLILYRTFLFVATCILRNFSLLHLPYLLHSFCTFRRVRCGQSSSILFGAVSWGETHVCAFFL